MSNELDLLKNSALLHGVDQSVVENFLNGSKAQTYKKDDVVYVEHSENDTIFFIVEGNVRGEIKLFDSDTMIDFKAGDFIGIETILSEETYDATMTTTTLNDIRVLTWPAQFWLQVFKDDAEAGYAVMFALAKLLRQQIKLWNMNVLNHTSWGIE